MIYEVDVSEQADRDLRGIFEYIAFELQSKSTVPDKLRRTVHFFFLQFYDFSIFLTCRAEYTYLLIASQASPQNLPFIRL